MQFPFVFAGCHFICELYFPLGHKIAARPPKSCSSPDDFPNRKEKKASLSSHTWLVSISKNSFSNP
jgi:hypothetical protein